MLVVNIYTQAYKGSYGVIIERSTEGCPGKQCKYKFDFFGNGAQGYSQMQVPTTGGM